MTIHVAERCAFECPRDQIRKITEYTDSFLGSHGMKEIYFDIPHGEVKRPATEDFHIWIWSSATKFNGKRVRERSWHVSPAPFPDMKICGDTRSISRWEEGKPIIINGVEVGAYDEHNLYTYYDAAHNGEKEELEAYRQLLQVMMDDMAPAVPATKESYAEFCMKRLKVDREAATETAVNLNIRIEKLNKDLINAIRSRDLAMEKAEGISKEDCKLKFMAEFDNLLKSPKIMNIGVAGKMIIVDTALIRIVDTKHTYEIGEFTIRINTEDGRIRFLNKTRRMGGYSEGMHHPHVFPDGHACWGNIESSVSQYVATGEYAALITVLIAFLEQCNRQDAAGKHLGKWPIAKKVRATKVKVNKIEKAPKAPKAEAA